MFPLRSPLIRSKLCSFFILVTWILATDFNSPEVFILELVEDPEGTWSVKRWKKVFEESLSFASFLLAHNILFTYIPVLLLVILYLIIFIILQMSIAIVTVFVLCWLPFSTNHLIMEYQDSSAHFSCSFSIYFFVTYFMIHAYCAINPIIYFIFNSNYLQGIKRLIKCSFLQA